MNTLLLDEMIDYIENNITEPINYNKLSKIVGLPIYILQRVFQFLTNMTINEYVRKRKLSKAYENLLEENLSITEIAFKYNYSSVSSFSRSFKNLFNCTPKNVRKKSKIEAFPKLIFNKNILGNSNFCYKIDNIDSLILYGRKIEINEEYYPSQIYELYNSLHKEGILKIITNNTSYGITIVDEDKMYYFVGSIKKHPNLERFELKKSKYFFIENIAKEQNDIIDAEYRLHNSYLPSTKYTRLSSTVYELEIYKNNNCTVAVPIN